MKALQLTIAAVGAVGLSILPNLKGDANPAGSQCECRPGLVLRTSADPMKKYSSWENSSCAYRICKGSASPVVGERRRSRSDKDYEAAYRAAQKLSKEELASQAKNALASIKSICVNNKLGNSKEKCECFANTLRKEYDDFTLVDIAIYNDYYIGLGRTAHPHLQVNSISCGVFI